MAGAVRARAHVEFRPMTPADVEAVEACAHDAFAELGRRAGRDSQWPEPSAEDMRRNRARFAHQLRQDPGGCWVAEAEDGIVGCSIAILREDVWGLSLLVVSPEHQRVGIGAVLLDRALGYGDGGRRGAIILSSDDPGAIRRYRQAGFELRPAMLAAGAPAPPDRLPGHSGVRPGDLGDLALCEEVGRHVRGASHGPDLRALIDSGAQLLIGGDRGFCLHIDGTPRLLAATAEDVARNLLLASLSAVPVGEECFFAFLDERQAWAIDVAMACGLRVVPAGPIFVRGELGPMAPYIPSGAYL